MYAIISVSHSRLVTNRLMYTAVQKYGLFFASDFYLKVFHTFAQHCVIVEGRRRQVATSLNVSQRKLTKTPIIQPNLGPGALAGLSTSSAVASPAACPFSPPLCSSRASISPGCKHTSAQMVLKLVCKHPCTTVTSHIIALP